MEGNHTPAPAASGALREWLLSVAEISEQRVGRLLEILHEDLEADTVLDVRVLASRVGGAFDARLSELAAAKIRGALALSSTGSRAPLLQADLRCIGGVALMGNQPTGRPPSLGRRAPGRGPGGRSPWKRYF